LGRAKVSAVTDRIRCVREIRVILDAELAAIYGVTTKHLNQQVKRNRARFPADFMFRLSRQEDAAMWSQVVTTSKSRRRADNPPFAFTEHGCLMVSNVLRVARAVEISVLIVRAFVQLRSAFDGQAQLAASVERIGHELAKHGRVLTAHEAAILKLLEDIRRLTRFPEPPRRPIGFTADFPDKN
jgi:hypothetical protein